MFTSERDEEETVTDNSNRKKLPTVTEVLEWSRALDGVVLTEWGQNPLRQKIGRIVFPARANSTKSQDSSSLIKGAINEFYPNVPISLKFIHACYINIQPSGDTSQILVLESNLQLRRHEPTFLTKWLTAREFPAYGVALRESRITPFLGVEGIRVMRVG